LESTLDNPAGVKQTFQMKNRVKELREQAGLSQGALGDAVGVSRQTINSIERGRYLPSLPLAFALARFFDTLVEEVFDADH
jgi:putative transcriptional regulator